MGTSDVRDQLQATLGTTYSLERELGRGGMATVFLAQDAKHHRPVALKVLHADLAASLGPERFRREITLAAGLQHPHILSVYDSGETPSGQLWFTMMYVDGESLRDRIRREHQLPLEEAVRITREAALALQYAHEHGVVHRDIKPENLLLTKDGSTLVADFGIARALNTTGPGATLTETGVAVGTPQYMSPEQASADRAIDARTDVYSLGAVCYEMLAGEPPFTGPTAQSIIAKMMSGEPPSVRRARPTVPTTVDTAIRKALAPVPGDRFATTADFAKALTLALATAASAATTAIPSVAPTLRRRGVRAALLTALAVAAAGAYAWRSHERTAAVLPGTISIAVLPFDNLGDSSDAYFADGMTDAVRGKLTTVPGLAVIAPASSAQYRKTTKSPQQIGRELRVRYLLMGRVRWSKLAGGPSRVQVNPALIDAATASDRWEAPFDAPLTDVFQVQADIATRVAQQLQLTLTPAAQRTLAQQPTRNLDAYDAYLRAREIETSLGTLGEHRAAAGYGEAIRRDSSFALAWAALAQAHLSAIESSASVTAADDAETARLAAQRALALAPDLPEAHAALGRYYELGLGDAARALAEYQAGRRLAPDNALLLALTAGPEWTRGQYDSSLAHRELAARLDPRDVDVVAALCDAYAALRRYAEAERACDQVLALAPTNMEQVEERMTVSLEQGDLAGARAVVRAVPATVDSAYVVEFLAQGIELGWVLDSVQQRLLLRQTKPIAVFDRGTWMGAFAQMYAYRGDTARARIYADSARGGYEAQLKAISQSRLPSPPHALSQLYEFHGLALAYLGRRDSALAQAKRAEAAEPGNGYVKFTTAKIYILLNEPDRALDLLEPALTGAAVPNAGDADTWITPGWLHIDPNFARLRGDPRFERLMAKLTSGATPPKV